MKSIITTILILSTITAFAQKERVLVISGGGSRGAWGGGIAKQFVKTHGRNYRAIFGTSSGSLLAPMIASDKFPEMEEGFTKIKQTDIFNQNPFKNNGKVKSGRAFFKVLFGAENLGETKNLHKRIGKFFSDDDYQKLRQSKTIVVSVVSLTRNRLDYKSSDSISDYNRMVNWVWASANQPVFMSSVKMDGEQWVDGGIKENVPIQEAIRYARAKGIDSIDVIVLNTLKEHIEGWPIPGEKDNVVPKIMRTINIFSDEIKISDITIGQLTADAGRKIHLAVYSMNQEEFALAPQSLLFSQEKQQQLWDKGFNRIFLNNKAVIEPTVVNNVEIKFYN